MSKLPPKAPVPPVYAHLPQYAFGHTKEAAEALCTLVLEGKKTATSSALFHYEDDPVPEPGDCSVLLDGSGRPRCVIECVSSDVVPFDEVDAEFAAAEGEGDKSLAQWRKAHEESFKREGYFALDMLVVCEHFRIVERLDFKRVMK
jgi:uncharacterized protein YhfF